MAVAKYSYQISTAFPNHKVNVDTLEATIQGSPISVALQSIDANVIPDQCGIYFVAPLPAPDVAILDSIVASHQGIGYVATLMASAPVFDVVVVNPLVWQVIGGVVTTPTFFTEDLDTIIGRITGQLSGDGGQIRIMEEVAGQPEAEMVVPPYDCPNTGGTWQTFSVQTNVPPRAGLQNVYRVEARLNGASALQLRFMTLGMVQIIEY